MTATLHIACLPFPTQQGTQAAIASMLDASFEGGWAPHLLTYAHGAFELDAPYPIHRLRDIPRVRSVRSGPSLGKIALDAMAVMQVRRLVRALQPKAVVAHHIEAAVVALVAGIGPVHYVAHTSLPEEFPTYLRPAMRGPAFGVATIVEREICRRAVAVGAVSPALADRLGSAQYLPVPWPASSRSGIARLEARDALGIDPLAPLALYAGNLDRYQGWEDLLAALRSLRRVHPRTRLLIATESDPTPVLSKAGEAEVFDAITLSRLSDEADRQRVHAAADFAWIPRRTPGGLPIKMLDAFARGVPVVATRRATSGLALGPGCVITDDDDPEALARAASDLVTNRARKARLVQEAETYLRRGHAAQAFTTAMDAFLRVAREPRLPASQPRSSASVRQAHQAPRE